MAVHLGVDVQHDHTAERLRSHTPTQRRAASEVPKTIRPDPPFFTDKDAALS